MSEYDDNGYIKGWPVPPARWGEVCKGLTPGRHIVQNSIPPGMMVIENYLDPNWCDALVKECASVEARPQTTGSYSNDKRFTASENYRRTSEGISADQLTIDIKGAIRHMFKTLIAPQYLANIEWFEEPEILKYKEGAEFRMHADSELFDKTEKVWKRVLDRDISILAYFNSDFEGGELVFPNFDFGIKPSRGLVVAFPSDGRYTHWARPVTSGVRYAIVSWAALKGGPRIHNDPPPTAIQV